MKGYLVLRDGEKVLYVPLVVHALLLYVKKAVQICLDLLDA